MTARLPACAAALLLFLVSPISVSAQGKSATETVSAFQQSLVAVMQNAKELGVKGRFDSLAPIIEKTFYLPVMISTASGHFWRAGTAEQRKRLLAAFRRMSVSSVATLFDGYDGETFRVVRERKTNGPTVLVDTEIGRKNDDPVEISYVSVNLRGRWWIIDVIVGGGISEVTVRRSEYLAILKDGGHEKLIAALEAQADRLLAGKEKGGALGIRH
jgi:phospholipid transport system substrate-binding protein